MDYSLYLHIPFCRHKCNYCDFNTYAGQEALIEDYVRALCQEVRMFTASAGSRLPVYTIYFGGGTPSLLSSHSLNEILQTLDAGFDISSDVEITLEANPGTVSHSYIRDLRTLGFNRLSLGMQSANANALAFLERQHDFIDVINAVKWIRQTGFSEFSLDLIFGLPYQSLALWNRDLDFALSLDPNHLSLYALTLEGGTPLQSWVTRGLVSAPDSDLAADMYLSAGEKLAEHHFIQYEISNWAASPNGGEPPYCHHNLQYWRNQPYIGLGAGGHGYIAGSRTENVAHPLAYIQRCLDGNPCSFPRTPATTDVHEIDQYTEMQETLLMGLRLTEAGVSNELFFNRFGKNIHAVFSTEVGELIAAGLLEWSGWGEDVLRLTPRGRLLGNQVFQRFV